MSEARFQQGQGSVPNNRDQRRGATVLLEVLRSEGARYVFGNPGTTELPLCPASALVRQN
jgi:hypothetical protein